MSCCYKCDERKLGCHDICDRYEEYKKEREIELKKRNTRVINVSWTKSKSQIY